MLALAADLGLRVVAEGVETPAQAGALVALGCGMAQGLLYGSAVPIEQLAPAGGRPAAEPPARGRAGHARWRLIR